MTESPPGRLPSILLIGGGKMGGAMLAGWRERGLAPSVVIDPAQAAAVLAGGPVQVVASAQDVPAGLRPAAVVLAVKPQAATEAIPPAAGLFGDAVVLSIMAGKTVTGLRALVGEGKPVVRAMPNTPAAIGQGITVAFAGSGVSAEQRVLCHTLLEAIGQVDWVEDEGLIDPVTAVSGGGPAYVFLLAEVLEQAAIEQGIPGPLARRLARVTVSGSGALLAASEQDAADLRIAVTSPGGTTQRALAVLMEAWPSLMSRAIAAATERSRELGG
jgi:pyrroline-5-carboxylate reductase